MSTSNKSRSKPSDDGPNSTVLSQDKLEPTKNDNWRLTTANHKLTTENQQLRAQYQNMQTQLESTLHPLNDLNQQWIANGRGHIKYSLSNAPSSSSAGTLDGPQSDGAHSFPAVVLRQIFSQVTDTNTLLTCRLVSKSWKSVIDNSVALMRTLTFQIIHPVFFMDLIHIVPVVRSIMFDYIRPFTNEQLEQMITTITPTLENVTFNFDKQWNKDDYWIKQKQIHNLVSVVLSKCVGLTELSLVGKVKEFMYGPEVHGKSVMVLCNITSLTMGVKNKTFRDKTAYEEVIRSLPKLSSLTLLDDDYDTDNTFDFVPVLSPVCEHMLKHPGVLKKFTYDQPFHYHNERTFDATSTGQKLWTKLYLIAGTNNVVINAEDMFFNLENLLVFDESYPINVKSCSAITTARHSYYSTRANPAPVHFKRILCCKNLQKIQINVYKSQGPNSNTNYTGPDELSYLWQLKNLQSLSLNRASGAISESIFAGPMPAVRRLEVCGEVFDSTAFYSSISVYFPNLVDLVLFSTMVPEDLFISLAKLERLGKLKLRELSSLTDTMFMTSRIGIPTIAPFASLKHLKISKCTQLTDKFLLYGFGLIATLKSFTLGNCDGITEAGFDRNTQGMLNMKTTIKLGEWGYGNNYFLFSTGF